MRERALTYTVKHGSSPTGGVPNAASASSTTVRFWSEYKACTSGASKSEQHKEAIARRNGFTDNRSHNAIFATPSASLLARSNACITRETHE
jgi:hypothetical protein